MDKNKIFKAITGDNRRIPYGVAIAVGTIAFWFLQPSTEPKRINVEDLDNAGLPSL